MPAVRITTADRARRCAITAGTLDGASDRVDGVIGRVIARGVILQLLATPLSRDRERDCGENSGGGRIRARSGTVA